MATACREAATPTRATGRPASGRPHALVEKKVRDGIYASLEGEKKKQAHGPLVRLMIEGRASGSVARLGDMAGSAPATPGRIFLSYRREETDFPAGWLHDRLAAHFGRDQVFRDVDDIPLGASFPEVIAKAVASCDVLLALIGAQWVTITDEEGKRRLEEAKERKIACLEGKLANKNEVIAELMQEHVQLKKELGDL